MPRSIRPRPTETDAVTCSFAVQCTSTPVPFPHSGRRGRRFKSGHPDQEKVQARAGLPIRKTGPDWLSGPLLGRILGQTAVRAAQIACNSRSSTATGEPRRECLPGAQSRVPPLRQAVAERLTAQEEKDVQHGPGRRLAHRSTASVRRSERDRPGRSPPASRPPAGSTATR